MSNSSPSQSSSSCEVTRAPMKPIRAEAVEQPISIKEVAALLKRSVKGMYRLAARPDTFPVQSRSGGKWIVRRSVLLGLDHRRTCVAGEDSAMSIKVRKFRTGGYEVDIHSEVAGWCCPIRERVKSPASSKEAAQALGTGPRGPPGAGARSRRVPLQGEPTPGEPVEDRRLWSNEEVPHLVWAEQRIKPEEVPMAERELGSGSRTTSSPSSVMSGSLDARPRHAHQPS